MLTVSELAEADLKEIWLYIAENDIDAANRALDTITNKFDVIERAPMLGRARHDLLVDLRSLPVKNYVIFYQLFDDRVEVFRVLHAARDIEQAFDEVLDRAN